jgi:ADP-heptose:LPS heptosyltransferase
MHFIGERIPAIRRIHDVEQNLNLLRKLGIQPQVEGPVFPLTQDDRQSAQALLARAGVTDERPMIVIHAGSAQTVLARAKRWPAEKYAQLIERLHADYPHRIILVEGPDESGVGAEIRSHLTASDCVQIVRLEQNLGVAGAVLERASLYVGSDSGLAHLAAAVGRRAVTIFAAADPSRVSPFGNRDLVVQSPESCSPCFTYPWETPYPQVRCKEPMCVTKVTVDALMEAVQRALGPTPTRADVTPITERPQALAGEA